VNCGGERGGGGCSDKVLELDENLDEPDAFEFEDNRGFGCLEFEEGLEAGGFSDEENLGCELPVLELENALDDD